MRCFLVYDESHDTQKVIFLFRSWNYKQILDMPLKRVLNLRLSFGMHVMAVVCVFGAHFALVNLQSSLNIEDGLGTVELALKVDQRVETTDASVQHMIVWLLGVGTAHAGASSQK